MKLPDIRGLKNSIYFKNVLTLVSGTSVAQLIPVLISPILTRLYSPEDFGLLALIVSISTIFGSLVSLKYELAIVLPKENKKALHITLVSLIFSFVFSVILLFVFIIFKGAISELFNNKYLNEWLVILPLIIFLISAYNSLRFYSLRNNNFKIIAKSTILKSVFLGFTQLSLGYFKVINFGLIIGYLVSNLVSNLAIFNFFKKDFLKEKSFNGFIPKSKKLISRYIDFPKYTLPSVMSNNISLHLNNFFISSAFSQSILGFYSLVFKSLSMPLALIGNAIGDVYFKKADDERKQYGNALKAFKKSFSALLLISLLIFIPSYFFIEHIFAFVFGKDWVEAGKYAKILLPLIAVRLIVSPLSKTCTVFEKQKLAFIWQITLLLFNSLICIFAYANNWDMIFFLKIYTLIITLHYLLFLFLLYNIASIKNK
jgi:O-antigen/teichoic acid export membrane protein